MADTPPLWGLDARGLSLAERPVEICVLRVRAPGEALQCALGDAFGLPWPTTPNTLAGQAPRVAWLAPGEWALFDAAERICDRVAAACDGALHHLADVSAGRRLWRIEGPHRHELIAKGCGIDTHPRVFTPGRCAQTLLAQVPILLVDHDGQGFDIVADASLAGHLRAWLADAALEYQP